MTETIDHLNYFKQIFLKKLDIIIFDVNIWIIYDYIESVLVYLKWTVLIVQIINRSVFHRRGNETIIIAVFHDNTMLITLPIQVTLVASKIIVHLLIFFPQQLYEVGWSHACY